MDNQLHPDMVTPINNETFFTGGTVVSHVDDNEALEVEAAPLVAVVLPGQTPVLPVEDPPPPLVADNFVCSEEDCLEEFATLKELKRHSKTHAQDKPFKCDECTASFNVEYNLTLHKAIHQKEKLECPACNKRFSRLASLKAHIMMHEKEEILMCPECGDEFSLQRELKHHMLSHNQTYSRNSAGEYPCKQCSEVFPSHKNLKDHIRMIHKFGQIYRRGRRKFKQTRFYAKNACPHCVKSFPKPSQLVRHIRIHTGEKPYKCHLCEKSFNQKGALNIHMTRHTKARPFACEQCPLSFSQRGNLRAHVVRVHELNSKLVNPHRCLECNCVFRKLGSLNSHMSKFHSSSDNPLALLRLGALQINKKLMTTTRTSADRPGGERDSAITSVATTNPNEDAPVDILGVPVVDLPPLPGPTTAIIEPAGAWNDESLKDIIQKLLELSQPAGNSIEHFDDAEEENRTSTFSTDILEQALQDCGLRTNPHELTPESPAKTAEDVVRVFTQILKRRRAMRSNTSRTHTCRFCQKDFKKPSDLVRHVRTHTQEKPFKCPLCTKSFTVKSTLTTHLKTHTGLKEYTCNVCQKLFSTHSSLKIHLRLHTGAKPFECSQCSKRFRTSGQRNVHYASHNRMSDSRGKSQAKRNLSDEDLQYISLPEPILITDTGLVQQPSRNSGPFNPLEGFRPLYDRPYKCGYCGKAFKKSSHLKQHIRTHTGEKPFHCHQCSKSFVSSGVLRSHLRVHTGDKAYKCIICERLFTTNGSLKRHMATHSDVRPFMCPYCQKTFKTSLNCKKHIKTHKQELLEGRLPQDTIVEPNVISEQIPQDQTQDISEQLLNQLAVDALRTQAQDNSQNPLLQPTSLTQEVLSQASLGGPANITNVSQFVQGLVSQEMIVSSNQGALSMDSQVSLQTREIQQQLEAITSQTLLPPPPPPPQPQPLPLPPPQSLPPQQSLPPPTQSELILPEPSQQQAMSLLSMDKSPSKRTFRCEFCEKSFKKSSHLKQHTRSHTGDKPYQCPECLRSFVSAGVLKNHLRTHTGSKPFECGSCGAVFTTNGSLTRHMQIHTVERKFLCQTCNAHFRTPTEFKRHQKVHDEAFNQEIQKVGKKPSKVLVLDDNEREKLAATAPQPNAPLSQKILAQLSGEKNKVHEIVDKVKELENAPKFANVCSQCPKSFRKHCDLVRHIRIHTGEKPFSCDVCGKAFAVKSTLSCHMRTHKGIKQASCHICKTMFATVGSLKVHMRLHTGAKPYKCPKCDCHFRTSGSRKLHMESHFTNASRKRRKYAKERLEEQELEPVAVSISCVSEDPTVQQVLVSQPPIPTSMITAQSTLPTGSLVAGDLTGAEGLVTTAVVPIELQLNAANLTQSLQIQNSSLTVQIDPSLLQQLQQNPVTLQGGDIGQINLQLASNEVINTQPTLVALQSDIATDGTRTVIPGTDQQPMILQLDQASLQQLTQMNVANIHPQLSLGDIGQVSVPQLQLQGGGVHALLDVQSADTVGGTGTIIVAQPNQPEVPQMTLSTPVLPSNIQNMSSNIEQSISTSRSATVDLNDLQHTIDKTPTSTNLLSTLSMPPSSSIADTFQLQLSSDSFRPVQSPTPTPSRPLSTVVTPTPESEPSSDVLVAGVSEIFSPTLLHEELRSIEDTVGESMPSAVMMTSSNSAPTPSPQPKTPTRSSKTPSKKRKSQVPTLSVSDAAAAIGAIYACKTDGCTGEFMSMSELRAHQERMHKALRPHQCPVCSKSFKRSTHLKEHVEIHNPDRKNLERERANYPCMFCDKSFSKPSLVERHLRSHTGHRPFDCPECGKSFTQKNSLSIHMKTHTKEKPFECEYCGHAFSQKVNMKTHIQRQHSKEVAAATKSIQGEGAEVTQGSSSGTDREDTLDIENVMSRFFP